MERQKQTPSVRIELSTEQKEQIRAQTGRDVAAPPAGGMYGRRRRWVSAVTLGVLPLQLLTGCMTYRQAGLGEIRPGDNVRVHFSEPTDVRLYSPGTMEATLVSQIRLLEGQVAIGSGDTISLRGLRRVSAPPTPESWFLGTAAASFAVHRTASVSVARADMGKTALLVSGVVLGLWAVAAMIGFDWESTCTGGCGSGYGF